MVRLAALLVLLAGPACSSGPAPGGQPTNPSAPGPAIRVLVLTATTGFRHDSINTARAVLPTLGATAGFTTTMSDDASGVTAATLANHDVLFFAMTTGELPFTAEQKAAILAFVSRGGGFIGTHSATDTLYGWPESGSLVGAYFLEHPWTQTAGVIVEDRAHPTAAMLGDRFFIEEEFYTFRENPRPRVHVLLRLDPASVGAAGDYPLAWTSTHGSGRVYYNALGHFHSTWHDRRFQEQITAAIRWTAGR